MAILPAIMLVALAWLAAIHLMRAELEDAVASEYRDNANLALAFQYHTARTIRSVDHLLQAAISAHGNGQAIDYQGFESASNIDFDVPIPLLIADAAGHVTGGNALETSELSDREFFVRHRDHDPGTVLVGVPMQAHLSGRVIIPISRRMSFADGRFRGVAVAGLDPMAFVSYYRQMALGSSGMVELVGLDGVTRVRRTGTYTSAPPVNMGSSLMRHQAQSPSGNFLSSGRLEGVKRHTSFRTLKDFGLIVAVGTAQADVLEATAQRRDAFIAAATLFTLAVVLSTGLILLSMRSRSRALAEAQRSEAQFRATFHQAAIGIAHLGTDGRFLKVNEALCTLLGYGEDELLERNVVDLKPTEERARVQDAIGALLRDGVMAPAEGTYLRRDGSVLWASVTLALVRGPNGEPEYVVAMIQDIGERVAAQQQVLRRSLFDPLTDLPNRAHFADRLEEALGQARRSQGKVAVMFIDLDGFKAVNDTHGHAAGDALLREVAKCLAASLRAGDTAARLGGDEFAVVVTQVVHLEDVAIVARRILHVLGVRLEMEGHAQPVTASIGIAIFPDHGEDGEELLRKADMAMLAAKLGGKNGFRMHVPPPVARAA